MPLPAVVKPVTPVAVVVSCSLYETGGRSVNRSVKRVMWPADALVGVRPLFDDADGADSNASARFELTRVGSDGKPRTGKGLEVTLRSEERRVGKEWVSTCRSGW